MISNHYPITYGHRYAWVIALGAVIAGGLIRHFYNTLDEGTLDWTGKAALPGAALAVVAMAGLTLYRPDAGEMEQVAFKDVYSVVQKHCVSCHSATPSNQDFTQAPGGVALDSPRQIKAAAAKIRLQVVFSKTMPLGNQTNMTDPERKMIGAWIAQGAEIE